MNRQTLAIVVAAGGFMLGYHLLRCSYLRDLLWSVIGVVLVGFMVWLIDDENVLFRGE